MPYEKRPGTISVFGQKFKKSEKQPDYKPAKGETLEIDGQEYDIAVWERSTKAGDRYLRIVISKPYNRDDKDNDVQF